MNNVNKTLYIPLYGKAYVSHKGIILIDKKAEDIWNKEQFDLKGKSKNKYLAYYMAMRSYVFDQWLKDIVEDNDIILHVGCGMDSRCLRVNLPNQWYDVDFKEVIIERKNYYQETETYHMVEGDIRKSDWLSYLPKGNVIVLLEGISMYVQNDELKEFFDRLSEYFEDVRILMDCYSVFGAKASKYKNPINDVGVTKVFGIDDPRCLETSNIVYIQEHVMTPKHKIDELEGIEKVLFKKLYAGKTAKKIYKMYEFKKIV